LAGTKEVSGWLPLPQQQAPAVGSAQHVPVMLLNAPVLFAGQSHTAETELTTIVSWPPTVAATPLMKPTAEVKVDTPSSGGLVLYQLAAPIAADSAQHLSGLPVQLANMVRPSSPSMAQ